MSYEAAEVIEPEEARAARERRQRAVTFAAASRLESAWFGVPFAQRLTCGFQPTPATPVPIKPQPTELVTKALRWADGDPLTAADLRELTGLPRERISSVLAHIQRRGLIDVEKVRHASRYWWRGGAMRGVPMAA